MYSIAGELADDPEAHDRAVCDCGDCENWREAERSHDAPDDAVDPELAEFVRRRDVLVRAAAAGLGQLREYDVFGTECFVSSMLSVTCADTDGWLLAVKAYAALALESHAHSISAYPEVGYVETWLRGPIEWMASAAVGDFLTRFGGPSEAERAIETVERADNLAWWEL